MIVVSTYERDPLAKINESYTITLKDKFFIIIIYFYNYTDGSEFNVEVFPNYKIFILYPIKRNILFPYFFLF